MLKQIKSEYLFFVAILSRAACNPSDLYACFWSHFSFTKLDLNATSLMFEFSKDFAFPSKSRFKNLLIVFRSNCWRTSSIICTHKLLRRTKNYIANNHFFHIIPMSGYFSRYSMRTFAVRSTPTQAISHICDDVENAKLNSEISFHLYDVV